MQVNTNPRRNTSADNESLREYNYHKLDRSSTQQLQEAAIKLIDKFFECDGNYVATVKKSPHWPTDPLKVFEKIEAVFSNQIKDDVDRRFLEFVVANTTRPFKWYKFNGGSVNLSPAQVGWWTKQLDRAGIDADFLTDKVPTPTAADVVRSGSSPQFHKLFE
jgi:hypothetical protein